MRYWLASIFCLSLFPQAASAQHRRDFNASTIPRHEIPIPPVGDPFGDRRHCHGPSPAWGGGGYYGGYYGGGRGYYGPGYGPGWGVSYYNSPFGYSSQSYSSISYGVPGFSFGYSAPLVSTNFYSPGWSGPNWGVPLYAPLPIYATPPSTPLPELPQWMFDDAGIDRNGGRKAQPLSQTNRGLIQPSTPEAQLRSVRLQDVGDRLMARLDYAAAAQSYAKSLQAAPDRAAPYVRLGLAKAARGDFRGAVSYLKQMSEVDPTHPTQVDSLERILGEQNGVAKVQLKQRVADWTKTDVRDPDRIFLLGVLLFLDGDDRFRTLLETAQKIDGDQPYLRAFLDSTPVQASVPVSAITPDEIDAVTAPKAPDEIPAPATLPPSKPLLLPPQRVPELLTP